MEQRKLRVLNRDISYLESGKAELGTILFIHGNSFSSQTFSKQFESPLFEGYRLLALDLYGHGDSEKLLNTFGYHLPNYAKLVIEFLKELNLSQVILAGHSLGGHIALEVLTNKIQNLVAGVFVWGTPPLSNPIKEGSAFLPNPAGVYLYQANLSHEEATEFVMNCFGDWSGNLESYIEVVKKTSVDARPSLGASVGQLNYSDEILAIKKAPFPVAVAYGKEDKFISPEFFKELKLSNIWENKAHPVNGSHFCHIDGVEEFNQTLLNYIQDCENLFFSDDREIIIENHITISI